MSFKIIDNFLPLDEYTKIKELTHSIHFPWLWSGSAISNDEYKDCLNGANNIDKKNFPTETKDDTFFFAHPFYMNNAPHTEYYQDIKILFKKLKANAIINARANLSVGGFNNWHCDDAYSSSDDINKTAIYCLGTIGATELHINGEITRIETVDNRMIIFDSATLHRAIYSPNGERRIVINLNYY